MAEESYTSITNITKDLERMRELTNGWIESLDISGGEPTLHPELLKVFEIMRNLFPVSRINLRTNGVSLLSQGDEFWNSVKKHRIDILATKYPTVDWAAVDATAAEHGTKIIYGSMGDELNKTSWRLTRDFSGSGNILNNFINCPTSIYNMDLKEGKIYCGDIHGTMTVAKHFGIDVELCEDDRLDIYKISSVQEIYDFVARPYPHCRYCAIDKRKSTGKYMLSNRELGEWVEE
ncbi:hypothetical protein AGMMS49941_13240 [Deferribacterales bacterium]|nr:hypothetical protein AGMMS49941_13240 [Deferribacterales bacterium]